MPSSIRDAVSAVKVAAKEAAEAIQKELLAESLEPLKSLYFIAVPKGLTFSIILLVHKRCLPLFTFPMVC